MTDVLRGENAHGRSYLIRARVREVSLPPIHDALVLGRESPIGCAAIRKALDLVSVVTFKHFKVPDDVISDVLVRAPIVVLVPWPKLLGFILERIKPLMGPDDILHLDLETEVTVEDAHV